MLTTTVLAEALGRWEVVADVLEARSDIHTVDSLLDALNALHNPRSATPHKRTMWHHWVRGMRVAGDYIEVYCG